MVERSLKLSITSGNGILVQYGGKVIALDPRSAPEADMIFISHAHIDHLHEVKSDVQIIASNETASLAEERGFRLRNVKEELKGYNMFDSGHILGSRGLLIEENIFYTGDLATRPRAFLERGKEVKCDILIVDSTYGKSNFRFPLLSEILEKVNRLISDLFSRGIPVVLMGYPLGKAQILSYLFSSWDPIYVHDSVDKMNQAYIKIGVNLRRGFISYKKANASDLLKKKPWVLISPPRGWRDSFISVLKSKYNAVTIAFTGWNNDSGYRYAMSADYVFPLSDHSDFYDLVDFVRGCSPRKVYTVFGFASEFATHLKELGYDATPL